MTKGIPAGRPRGKSICCNALFLQDHLGGIGNYTYHLIRGIRALRPDWDLTLLVHAGTAPHFRSLEGVRIAQVNLRRRWARLAYLHLYFPWRARRFDALHSIGNMGLIFCPATQVITIHDLYERVSPERFSLSKRLLMRFLISWSGKRARAIISVSGNTKRDIARFYPHLSAKTTVVYSGIKFPPAAQADASGRAGFIFVGTLEPGKNLAHILRAFATFSVKYPGRLKVVGAEGWGQSDIPELLASLGIGDKVEFAGYVSDEALKGLYSSSLALLMASAYEGFGLPVIEAMACGCPVISARNSGLIEAGGDAALFFPTGDVAELARRMEEIHLDEGLRGECIRKGLAHAAAFSWEETARRTVSVFESLEKE
jgi:glycosyltransferase involved in cell wall biosynthesis